VHATAASLFASFVQQIITRAPAHLPPLAQAVAASRDFFAPIQTACVTAQVRHRMSFVTVHNQVHERRQPVLSAAVTCFCGVCWAAAACALCPNPSRYSVWYSAVWCIRSNIGRPCRRREGAAQSFLPWFVFIFVRFDSLFECRCVLRLLSPVMALLYQ
jgi:hypothetical protein